MLKVDPISKFIFNSSHTQSLAAGWLARSPHSSLTRACSPALVCSLVGSFARWHTQAAHTLARRGELGRARIANRPNCWDATGLCCVCASGRLRAGLLGPAALGPRAGRRLWPKTAASRVGARKRESVAQSVARHKPARSLRPTRSGQTSRSAPQGPGRPAGNWRLATGDWNKSARSARRQSAK